MGILIFINYCLNLEVVDVCFAHTNKWVLFVIFEWHVRCPNFTKYYILGWHLMHLINPITMVRICSQSWHGEVLTASFSLPPSRLSLLLENLSSHCKKKKKVWLFVCEVKLDFHSFNYNVFSLELFIINFFF